METDSVVNVLDRIQNEFSEKVTQRRCVAMDVCEGLFEHSPHWPMLRKKLLGFFGDSGVQGDLLTIIAKIKRELSEPRQLEFDFLKDVSCPK